MQITAYIELFETDTNPDIVLIKVTLEQAMKALKRSRDLVVHFL
jgi:hypothetical protein